MRRNKSSGQLQKGMPDENIETNKTKLNEIVSM